MSIEELLPPGWVVLRDCSIGTGPGETRLEALREAPLPIPLVLLHPEIGVALLETGPEAATAPGMAEAALRRRLEAARFAGIFAGHLPVLHRRIAPAELPALRDILAEGFAALPPLTVPGGDAWVGVVRRALRPRDPGRSGVPLGLAAATADWHAAAGEGEELAADQAAPSRRPLLNRLAAARSPEEPATTDAAQPGGVGEDRPVAASSAAWWRRPGTWAAAGLGAVVVAGALAFLGGGGHEREQPGVALPPPPPPPPMVAGPAPPVLPPAGPPSSREPVRPAAPAAPSASPPPSQAERAAPSAATAPPAATVVVRTRSNLRTGPNDRAPVLRILPRGQSLRLLDRAPGGWVQVGDPQPIGWVHSSLLDGAEP